MSLDIYLTVLKPSEVFEANITHNLARMWREAGCVEELYESQGKTAGEILPALEKAHALMVAEPARFKAMNATNGWGTYDDALPWLARLIAACKENPSAVIGISR